MKTRYASRLFTEFSITLVLMLLILSLARVPILAGAVEGFTESERYASTLNMTLKTETISIGENITLTGLVTPPAENLTVTLIFTSPNGTVQQTAYTVDDGTFATSFRPEMQGNWLVQANFKGDNQFYESSSQSLRFKVNPPSFLRQYSTYIYAGAGAGGGTAVLAFVYVRRRRT